MRWKDAVSGIAHTVGKGAVCTMQLKRRVADRFSVFTVTSKDSQPLANAANLSQMYNSTRHTSQVSPCDW